MWKPTPTSSLTTALSCYKGQKIGKKDKLQEKIEAILAEAKELLEPWKILLKRVCDGETVAHLACYSGDPDFIADLIRMSPNPDLLSVKNNRYVTPLQLATLRGQPNIIRLLLIAGADPNVRDRNGYTALHFGCMIGEEECVRALTTRITFSEVRETYRHCRHHAQYSPYNRSAKLPSGLEIPDDCGYKCVNLAAENGFINILRILVLHGADINAGEGTSGLTPLHMAIERDDEDLLNYLLNDCKKLNLEATTHAGFTAYQLACLYNNSKMKNILEKYGAKPLTPSDNYFDGSVIQKLLGN